MTVGCSSTEQSHMLATVIFSYDLVLSSLLRGKSRALNVDMSLYLKLVATKKRVKSTQQSIRTLFEPVRILFWRQCVVLDGSMK